MVEENSLKDLTELEIEKLCFDGVSYRKQYIENSFRDVLANNIKSLSLWSQSVLKEIDKHGLTSCRRKTTKTIIEGVQKTFISMLKTHTSNVLGSSKQKTEVNLLQNIRAKRFPKYELQNFFSIVNAIWDGPF